MLLECLHQIALLIKITVFVVLSYGLLLCISNFPLSLGWQKPETMVYSNLAPWKFVPDSRVILVLLSGKVGGLSAVTIFTLPYPTLW